MGSLTSSATLATVNAMGLNISSHVNGTNLTLELAGQITLGAGSMTLREEMQNALAANASVIILDCACVDFVDSSGLAEFISAHVKSQKTGRTLILKNIGWRLKTLLDATRLSTVLNICSTLQPEVAHTQ